MTEFIAKVHSITTTWLKHTEKNQTKVNQSKTKISQEGPVWRLGVGKG